MPDIKEVFFRIADELDQEVIAVESVNPEVVIPKMGPVTTESDLIMLSRRWVESREKVDYLRRKAARMARRIGLGFVHLG